MPRHMPKRMPEYMSKYMQRLMQWTLGFLVLLLTACASGDRPLQLRSGDELAYPEAARQQGIEGVVVVGYDVNVSGEVENVVIIESQPPGVFDAAALKTVQSWRFQPRQQAGRAVASNGRRSRLTFQLGGKDPYPGL